MKLLIVLTVACMIAALNAAAGSSTQKARKFVLDSTTPTDGELQHHLEAINARLLERFGMKSDQVSVGVVDLVGNRAAMLRPDEIDYAASIPKIGILLAYFQLNPDAATQLDPQVRKELGEMIKVSSNEMASKYSHFLGLKNIQNVLNSYGFYDPSNGGGIWVGKHYGKDAERYPDPVGDHSHAATVRQLLRFYVMLEQGELVSPEASKSMRKIFESPDIKHDDFKFVKGLAGRDVQIIRKSGSWENWLHDTAVVTGEGRHYILVAMTRHPKGDDYLAALAPAIDDVLSTQR